MICLPKEAAEALRKAARDGKIKLSELIDNPEKRIKVFSEIVGKEGAEFLDRGLRRAAKDETGEQIIKWANRNFKDKTRANKIKQELLDTMEESGQLGIGDDGFEVLAMEEFGISLDTKVANKIIETASELDRLYESSGRLTDVFDEGGMKAYFKKKEEMEKLLLGLNPSKGTQVFSSVWGRSALLMSAASPTTNIISNTARGIQIGITKMLQHGVFEMGNTKMVSQYVKRAASIYKDSGFDITRMESIDESRMFLREKQDIHAEGAGLGRAASRIMQDISMKYLMGYPDVVAAALQRAQTASLLATKQAMKEGLTGTVKTARIEQLMQDALQISPKTELGMDIKRLGIQDAAEATWTNNSWGAKTATTIRKFINELPVASNLRLGDANIPFAKTPGNVIAAQLDDAGLGAFTGVFKIWKGSANGNKALVSQGARELIKTGVAWGGALALVSFLKPQDYIGSYEQASPAERKLVEAKNGAYNSVKIAGKWISLDYFGSMGGIIGGYAQAQKSTWIAGLSEAAQRALDLPGLREGVGMAKDLETFVTAYDKEDIMDMVNDRADALASFISSRSVPRILVQLEDMLYPTRTKPDYDNMIERLQYAVPIIRKSLDPRKNIFGENVQTQNPMMILFFGARVKQALDEPVVNELDALYRQGALPVITDVATSSSRFKEFRQQVSKDKFNSAMEWYGNEYKNQVLKEIKKSSYQKLEATEKKAAIDGIRRKLMDSTLKKFGYKKPSKK